MYNKKKYDFQRGITQKLRKVKQSFLCETLCVDLIIYISIKYHEDILKIVYGQTYGQRHAIICSVFSKLTFKNEGVLPAFIVLLMGGQDQFQYIQIYNYPAGHLVSYINMFKVNMVDLVH